MLHISHPGVALLFNLFSWFDRLHATAGCRLRGATGLHHLLCCLRFTCISRTSTGYANFLRVCASLIDAAASSLKFTVWTAVCLVCQLPYSIEHHKKSIYGIWLTGGVLKSTISSVTIQTCAIMQSQLQQSPDISRLSPKLQQQWDHQKNAHLGNIIITHHTKRIVSWRCSDCPDGHPHEWETSVK